MKNGLTRLSVIGSALLVILVGTYAGALAAVPDGHRDVKLGMKKPEVLELLKKSPVHFSYDETDYEISEIIRNDELFRFATYRFSKEGVLVEIDLQMREILGRDRVLELYNSRNGINVSPAHSVVDSGRTIEVRDNALIMRLGSPNREARSTISAPD